MENLDKKIGIVIDTNIWRSNLLLKTPLGSALLYFLRRINGYIILPEIIEDEVVKHTVETGLDAIDKINTNFRIIEILMGSRIDYELPDKNQLELVARNRFTELEKIIVRVPLTLEQARGAIRRINEGKQPNGHKNQQFKDSVIWEAILTLLDSYNIHFITSDNGFFKDKKADTNRLADNLQEDCKKRKGRVFIHKDVESCLKNLEKDAPSLNQQELIKAIDQVLPIDPRQELLLETGFEVIELSVNSSSVSAFLTEIVGKLALSFELQYKLVDTQTNQDDEMRRDATLEVVGECLYEPETSKISEINIQSERVKWLEPTGEPGQRGVVFAKCFIGGGSSPVKYQFKKPIEVSN